MNIIGEHIDYLGGVVLPFACDRELRIRIEPDGSEVVMRSLGEEVSVAPDGSSESPDGWGRYVWGVLRALTDAGWETRACRGEISSDIPAGAGLSSSAAIEAAVALAVTGGGRPPPELLQRAEQIATGVPCGLMDQAAVLGAQAGHAMLLDCRTGAIEQVPIPGEIGFVVIDTGTRRELADGRYARRRGEVERGHPDRARHARTEQARVYAAVETLRSGDAEALGDIIDASHASLRDDFDVSAPALDAAAEVARTHEACTGARLVGAGFAGCVLAVVKGGREEEMAAWVRAQLRQGDAFSVHAVDGAGEV